MHLKRSFSFANAIKARYFHRSKSSAKALEESQSFGDTEFETAKPFEEIPGPKGLPFVGTLLQYRIGRFEIHNVHKSLITRYREFGPIYKETMNDTTIVHVFDPELAQLVYRTEGRVPHTPPLMETTKIYRKIREMAPGLGNTNGEDWYRLRKAIQQMMMRPKAVTMYLPQVNEVADDFIANLDRIKDTSTNKVKTFRNEVLRWALESSGSTCFETRLGCIGASMDSDQQEMVDANETVFTLALKLKFSLPIYKFIPTPTWKRLVEAEDLFFGNGQKLVDKTVKKIDNLTKKGELQEGQFGFLTYLLGRKDLSYKDLSIITLSLFADTLSTTAPTLIGQLYCLAANPVKQEKARDEINSIVQSDGDIEAKHIDQMSYLKSCVKEGFRFFPIGTEVSRIPQKDMVISGYHIPAGTQVEMNTNMLLRLPEYFSDPESYIPERWARGDDQYSQTVHPYLMTPFSHGPRMCPGRRFAEQEMYVVMAKILRKFRIGWDHPEPMTQIYHLLLRPNNTEHFTFTPLNE